MSKVRIIVIVLMLVGLSLATACFPVINIPAFPSSTEGLDLVAEARDIILQDYVEQESLDADELSRGAIKGMVEALDDPYSAYLDPEMYQLSLSDFEGKFEGVGAHVAIRDGQIVIIAPIPDTPADNAGIRAGDKILEEADVALGVEDPVTDEFERAMTVLQDARNDIAEFIERGKMIENF